MRDDLPAGGRGLSRARRAGRVEDARPASVSLSPASIRGVMQELEERGLLTHPHTSAGRMPTESGPPAVRRRDHAGGRARAPQERAAIEAQLERDRPIEEALAAATAALVRPVGLRRRSSWPRSASRVLRQLELRPARRRAGRWRCWSAPTAASRTASSTCRREPPPSALDRGRQLRQRPPVRPDPGRGAGAGCAREIAAGQGGARRAPPPS